MTPWCGWRRSAIWRSTDPQTLFKLGMPLLDDPVRTVRLEAARTLAPLMRYELPEAERARLDAALDAYRAAQLVIAERPESHHNIGLVEMAQGKAGAWPRRPTAPPCGWTPDSFRPTPIWRISTVPWGRTRRARRPCARGSRSHRESADLHHALGLLYIRGKRLEDALGELRRAAELGPDNPRYPYVYAVALKETGDVPGALEILADAYGRHPANRDILLALVTINRDAGNLADARSYAQALRRRYPDDRDAAALARELSPAR